MPKAVLYHNPRCSKSREALAYLNEQLTSFEVVEYLKQPLSKAELMQLYLLLNLQSSLQMTRIKEQEFKLAGLSKNSSDDEILSAIEQYPKLLERPILVLDDKAAIGRPLEQIKDLLNA